MKFQGKYQMLLSFFLRLFFSINCVGQEVSKNNNETDILEINRLCAKINTDTSKFTISQKDIFDLSSEGGFLRTYYEGKTLHKVFLVLFGENGQSTEEYYLSDNKLIYLYESGISYTHPFYMKESKIKSEEVNRYFFKDLKLIKWTDNKEKTFDKSLYVEKQIKILLYFNAYILTEKTSK
jgi:hypothetical protein